MRDYRAVLLIAFALIVGTVCVAQAGHTDARHCADDCRRFCSQWGLETRAWKIVAPARRQAEQRMYRGVGPNGPSHPSRGGS